MKTKLVAWKPLEKNEILQGEGFYLSYNPSTGEQHNVFTDLGNMLGGNLKDGEETALRDEVDNLWLILEGDFRKEYSEVFSKGREACIEVYKKNIKHRSNWSTD